MDTDIQSEEIDNLISLNGVKNTNSKSETQTDEYDTTPDDILHQLGGCGRYQVLLAVTIQVMKCVVCWGMVGNAFFAFVPDWRCADDDELLANTTTQPTIVVANDSVSGSLVLNETQAVGEYWNQKCKSLSGKKCRTFQYDASISTLVNEFDLVCDYSWVTATITSVQMAGMCVGSLFGGQLADLYGRKKPLILSMLILSVFHLMCYFSGSWVVYTAARFFIGVGSSIFLTIYCIIQSEFTLSKWRAVVIGFPSWAFESSLFALVAWLLHDWRHLSLTMSIMAFAFIGTWLWVPESFRWLYVNDRQRQAERTVATVAKWNKCPVPDLEHMRKVITTQSRQASLLKKFTLIDVFRRKDLLKLTLPLMISWMTMGLVAYGINFGIKKLSGSLYMNLFVFSIASLPSKLISTYLQNKIGRNRASMVAFGVCVIGGFTVGIVQYIDTPYRDSLTNYFALAASVGVDGTWGPMQTLTLELYPTIVRNASFGLHSVMARLGAVLGPQFVFLDEMVPGILYFVVGAMSLIAIIVAAVLPETMNKNLLDCIVSDDIAFDRKEEHHSKQNVKVQPTNQVI